MIKKSLWCLLIFGSFSFGNFLQASEPFDVNISDTSLIADYIDKASQFYDDFETDSSIAYANQALALSKQLFYADEVQNNEVLFSRIKTLTVESYIIYALTLSINDTQAAQDTLIATLDLLQESDAFQKGLIYTDLSFMYGQLGQTDNYLKYSKMALAAYEASENVNYINLQQINLGLVLNEFGNYAEALDYFIESLKTARQLQDSTAIVESLLGMGNVYAFVGDWEESISVQLQALDIYEQTNDEWGIARIHNDMGITYSMAGKLDSSLVHHKMALKQRLESTDNVGIFNSYTYVGDLLAEQGSVDSAIVYYDNALAYTEDFKYSSLVVTGYILQGDLYLQVPNLEKAKERFEIALNLSEQNGDLTAKSRSTTRLARIAAIKGQNSLALELLRRAEVTNPKLSLHFQIELYQDISEIYFMIGDYKNAYLNSLIYSVINDSLVLVENISEITRLTNVMAFENEIALKRESNSKAMAIQQAEIDRQKLNRNIFLGGMIFAIILVAITLVRFFEKKKLNDKLNVTLDNLRSTQKQLIQSEKMASLGELTAGIAHEIQNPLNFVNNFAEVSEEILDEIAEELAAGNTEDVVQLLSDIRQNLSKINHHGRRADSIIKGMLQHSRGSSGKMEEVDFNSFIQEFVNLSFHGMRAGKSPINVDIVFDLDNHINKVPLISEDFSRVVVNLCNNAFDAMRDKGNQIMEKGEKYIPKLSIRTSQNTHSVSLQIEDNGPGIPEEIKDKILQPFFTTKKGTEGTGLGLSITNDIIKAHGGNIAIKSENGESTTFTVDLQYQNPIR